jgi:hypothetical protein
MRNEDSKARDRWGSAESRFSELAHLQVKDGGCPLGFHDYLGWIFAARGNRELVGS